MQEVLRQVEEHSSQRERFKAYRDLVMHARRYPSDPSVYGKLETSLSPELFSEISSRIRVNFHAHYFTLFGNANFPNSIQDLFLKVSEGIETSDHRELVFKLTGKWPIGEVSVSINSLGILVIEYGDQSDFDELGNPAANGLYLMEKHCIALKPGAAERTLEHELNHAVYDIAYRAQEPLHVDRLEDSQLDEYLSRLAKDEILANYGISTDAGFDMFADDINRVVQQGYPDRMKASIDSAAAADERTLIEGAAARLKDKLNRLNPLLSKTYLYRFDFDEDLWRDTIDSILFTCPLDEWETKLLELTSAENIDIMKSIDELDQKLKNLPNYKEYVRALVLRYKSSSREGANIEATLKYILSELSIYAAGQKIETQQTSSRGGSRASGSRLSRILGVLNRRS